MPISAVCNHARGIGNAGAQLHFYFCPSLQTTSSHAQAMTLPMFAFSQVLDNSFVVHICSYPWKKRGPYLRVHPCSADDCNFVTEAYATDSLQDLFVMIICSMSPIKAFLAQRDNPVVTRLIYNSTQVNSYCTC